MAPAAFACAPAKPDRVDGWRRRRQDAALAALGRTSVYCPSRRSLASLASDAPVP